MKLGVFVVYDSKALSYGTPVFLESAGVALRGLEDAANDPQSPIGKHPADYILWQVAEYDPRTGVVEKLVPFVNLGNASALKKQVKEPVVFQPAASDGK